MGVAGTGLEWDEGRTRQYLEQWGNPANRSWLMAEDPAFFRDLLANLQARCAAHGIESPHWLDSLLGVPAPADAESPAVIFAAGPETVGAG